MTGTPVCDPFANPSHFGFDCGGTPATTVDEILGRDQTPTCWDEVVTEPAKYGYKVEPEDPPYYIHTCVSGVMRGNSPHNQPGMQINQRIITIPLHAGYCSLPYTEQQTGQCIMQLLHNQPAFAAAIAGGSIPDALVTAHPSSTLRTHVLTWFGNYSFAENGDLVTLDTPTVRRGPVSIYAHRDDYRIYPYGLVAGGPSAFCPAWQYWSSRTQPITAGTCEDCDGSTALVDRSTPPDDPQACWWSYPRSSSGFGIFPDTNTYPFVAEADWTVLYTDDHGHDNWPDARFRKFTNLHLPVNDVQDLNLG